MLIHSRQLWMVLTGWLFLGDLEVDEWNEKLQLHSMQEHTIFHFCDCVYDYKWQLLNMQGMS